jgi:hypothetical protein
LDRGGTGGFSLGRRATERRNAPDGKCHDLEDRHKGPWGIVNRPKAEEKSWASGASVFGLMRIGVKGGKARLSGVLKCGGA